MPVTKCIICGIGESEVEKLHYFPRNIARSKEWQEAMGMIPFDHRINYRICCRHFTSTSYKGEGYILKNDAIPTLYPAATTSATCVLPSLASALGNPHSEYMESEDLSEPITSNVGIVQSEVCTASPLITVEASQPGSSGQCHELPIKSMEKKSLRVSTTVKKRRTLFKEGFTTRNATSREKQLMEIVRKKEDHIRKLKRECKQRKRFKDLCKLDNSAIVDNVLKDIPSTTADFLISQLRCASRTPRGRRWMLNEKITALALYKRSPKCYNLLRKFIALPSRRTLTMLLEKIPFESGINDNLFQHINNCLSSSKDEDRICVILFDEMDIKENIQYVAASDSIKGYEDFGLGQTSRLRFANKALVFMAQGLRKKWKQPLAYYLCYNSCSADKLQQLLLNVLNAAKNIAKLNVVATVCDMGTNNVSALKNMNSTIKQPYIVHEGKRIFTIFDPPHLLKCTASLFRKHKVCLPVEISGSTNVLEGSFEDVLAAYKVDQESPLIFRSMHKLKEVHLAPIMRSAMKVKIAAQLLSRTVAAFIFSVVSRGILPQRAIATATFIHEVDELFDSFNGNSRIAPDGKPHRCWMTDESPHLEYWGRAYKRVEQWNFQRPLKSGSVRTTKPPSQLGWLTTIRAIQGVWKATKGPNFMYLRPRSLNQDSLENLFGAIRSGCGCNENPTVTQFISSLKTQIINGLVSGSLQGTNCEMDDGVLLSNLRYFIDQADDHVLDTSETSTTPDLTSSADEISYDIAEAVSVGTVETLSVAYVSGYIAGRILQHISCDICYKQMTTEAELPCNDFIDFKDVSRTKKLVRPSENLVIVVGQGITKVENMLNSLSCARFLEKEAGNLLCAELDFSWLSCEVHENFIKDNCIKGICRIGIPWFCKRENQRNKAARLNKRASKRKLQKLKHL